MVQIFQTQGQPGLGALLGSGISQVFTSGAQSLIDALMKEKIQQRQLGNLSKVLFPTGQQGASPTGTMQQTSAAPENQQQLTNERIKQITDNPQAMMQIESMNKPMADMLLKMRSNIMEEKKFEYEKSEAEKEREFKREEKSQEPIKDIRNRLQGAEMSGMRFGRLGELFAQGLEEKFPPNFLVGALTKEGELRPIAQSMLSPEAQESVKLIMDEMTGAKDTYGARVTNFDAMQYLKRLPTLLNSPEGRRRVLRDLQIINQINQLHDREILNIIEEHGGSGKISIDKAEAIFDKKFDKQKKDLQKLFITGGKGTFNNLQDPKLLKGRRMQDEETKQIFISDGEKWIPQ